MSEVKAVDCQVYKIQTLVDSGSRITIDVGFDASWLVQDLLARYMAGNNDYKIVFIKE